jgi:glycine dehydrogenase
MNTDSFAIRHIGPRKSDLPKMLQTIGVDSMEQLMEQTIPDDILLSEELQLDEVMSEQEYLEHINELASSNILFKTYIGLGYHQSITPPVIQRNILENPGWYTAYTPYQAEIAQGRLEALLNFQTMVTDLTGMELANASLLDEATSAAEAMALLFAVRDLFQMKYYLKPFPY